MSNGLLFNDSVGLLKTTELKLEPKKGVVIQLDLSKGVNKYVEKYQKSRGTTKAMACQILVLTGLKKSALLDESVMPIGKLMAGSGRRAYSDNPEIKTVIKLPVKAHNAIVTYRINNQLNEKITAIAEKFIIDGLEKEGFLRVVTA